MERLISDASKMTDVQKELNVSVKEGDTSFGNIVNAISVMQKKMKITGTTSKEAATTISGSINSMKAAWDNFLNGTGSGTELADSILTAFSNITDRFIELLPGLVEGLVTLVNGLIPQLPEIINKVLPTLLKCAVDLIKGLAVALPTILTEVFKSANYIMKSLAAEMPKLIPMLVEAILGLIPVLIENLPLFIEAGIQLIIGLAKGLIMSIPTLLEKAWEIITKLVDAFLELPGKLWDIGVDLIKGLWEGIKSVGAWLWDKVSGFLGDIFGGILSFFGIGSPSKLLRDEVGQWIPKGMAVGITANVDSVTGAMDDMNKQILTEAEANNVVESMFDVQPNISGQMTSAYSPNIVVNVQNNMETDPLGQLVNNVKTFSGGAKNDYNWGAAI